jgi:hypothetical protein
MAEEPFRGSFIYNKVLDWKKNGENTDQAGCQQKMGQMQKKLLKNWI